ncbi:hypothetical protein GLOTRDRAFT_109457 [Gloeophyllum trabeum ATCC 11539]|uniref:Uncharacterized protein n=1 Tax=Gloeophyllum trabeum (strain ATCC 11539 / FP-39264 / Madison 617) TaxID=670483 RepID=S7RZM8_GLOTA|nr:uncharacterized protein GLOTRDRAFT_109457 [Gloeophyllum trabeum ATCC 11539]EPQ58904.1 hypothetical protein GLOTRDRAFT_109457 [Gloeophyllum trabeum ATCC 11539]
MHIGGATTLTLPKEGHFPAIDPFTPFRTVATKSSNSILCYMRRGALVACHSSLGSRAPEFHRNLLTASIYSGTESFIHKNELVAAIWFPYLFSTFLDVASRRRVSVTP